VGGVVVYIDKLVRRGAAYGDRLEKTGADRTMNKIKSLCASSVVLTMLVFAAPCPGSAGNSIFFANGPATKKAIAVTFDDGPGPWTEQILAMLKENNVKATFFEEGQLVKFRLGIVRQVLADGHEVGSHLYDHPDFWHYKKPDGREYLAAEIDKTEAAFAKINYKPVLLRMPYGYNKPWSREVVSSRGYTMINWSFGCDWNKMPADELAKVYIKHIAPGAILLMHDGGKDRSRTLAAARAVILEARKQGYEILTVSQLLGLRLNAGSIVTDETK
jgi:peptidoglycan-N-acetylglucosamine deacetylase